jgi:hypothetical protein
MEKERRPRDRPGPTIGWLCGASVPCDRAEVLSTISLGSLGEASANCAAGTGDGISAGAAGWGTLTMPPGHYELVCNLTNHYADGMHQEFILTG